ncbi:hypothetical protein ES288_D01G229200v1 [Gossypium darwinii]|uniref:Uncharacterized protein n=1 Tax=Gossypium darwinii TaxID=34276 RepID=A0A5D2DTD6_GOSDA|nr:hypothetical protein ES288_D01G229200v1 [Gossypium darwinii]
MATVPDFDRRRRRRRARWLAMGKRPLCLSSTGFVTEEGVSDGEKTERLPVWPAGDVDEGGVHGFLPFWCKPARLWAVCAPRAHMGSSRGAAA